jgi:hypothetical protein
LLQKVLSKTNISSLYLETPSLKPVVVIPVEKQFERLVTLPDNLSVIGQANQEIVIQESDE